MKKLNQELEALLKEAGGDEYIIKAIDDDQYVFPFSRADRILAYLLSINAITYAQYVDLVQGYTHRNQYLNLFDMAPRTFGQTWGENHILYLFPEFIKATQENMAPLYPNFDGEFDLWFDGIRIEVKACRANDASGNGTLASRAYLHSEAIAVGFKYHFQQLKPSCCDVFIWIGVCRDELIYWVLTSDELQRTGKLSPQHRNANTGIEGTGVFEGQVFMTETELSPFLVREADILTAVREKGGR